MPIWWCFLHAKPASAELRDGEGILRGIRSQTSVGRHVSMMFPFLSGNEKSNTGQSDRSNRLPGRFSFVHCEKHSDIFRTRQKKQRQLQQLVQNTISPIKCSFRLCFLSLDSIALCINKPGHGQPLFSEQPRNIFSRIVCSSRSASGGILPVN